MKDLFYIARNNMASDLLVSIEQQIDINEKDEFGSTALHYAISNKHVNIISILLGKDADVTVKDAKGRTALHIAVVNKLYDISKSILEKNAIVVNMKDVHGNGPLWTASFNSNGDYALVSLLLRFGGNVMQKNKVGLCPQDIAEKMNDRTLLGILEENKNDT